MKRPPGLMCLSVLPLKMAEPLGGVQMCTLYVSGIYRPVGVSWQDPWATLNVQKEKVVLLVNLLFTIFS